ncbi:hypothetical protein ISN76_06925 [Dyella halodurans]|uniref:Lipoprotein n=1 Tax=Dyella halodurans TaxID=1920171 RepID=A0ABV9C4Q2_9GAMM|nr:hypothetical protein [Dyella halodurans]
MTPHCCRLALVALLVTGLSLAGCASKPQTRPNAVAGAPAATSATPQSGGKTGIAACDDYLANYLACHRAAAVFPPDQLEGRYQTMRASLLQGAQDPKVRPLLSARCAAMAGQLSQMLHGKPCGPVGPAPAATAGNAR